MMLLGVDVGTTHCKVGLVRRGKIVRLATRSVETHRTRDGAFFYAPDALWQSVVSAVQEVIAEIDPTDIGVVGIASMAETGLLVDRRTGEPRSHLIPWFDRRALARVERVARVSDARERFRQTGLPISFKYGLFKLLWLCEQDEGIIRDAIWLSAADYIAYRLTGRMATDYTLAARTYAFDVPGEQWDEPWLGQWNLRAELFPEAVPSGQPIGTIRSREAGLHRGTPVAIAGHDHLCAAIAVGAVQQEFVFNSMGTAETLMGTVGQW
ncbi:MAG: FGGY family carbohydrate kinase, partial [Chloroflexota bacterium]|nr:FGGY family carbohydrate kinase [Chloroflexota bacterium]